MASYSTCYHLTGSYERLVDQQKHSKAQRRWVLVRTVDE